MIEERTIIDRVLEGETDKFRLIVEQYNERIFLLVRGYVHQIEDAEDVTQETFLQAFISLGDFKGNSAFSTWLYRIAVNTSYSYLRKKNKRSVFSYYETKISSLAEHLQTNRNDNPQKQLSSKQTEEQIFKEIDKLPTKQRTAFILSRIQDMSQKEIAEVMSLSAHAVESLIQRAKKQLKIKLISIINENKF
jgi:RNA polymerase sigma-70 factor (ECF subfamily)